VHWVWGVGQDGKPNPEWMSIRDAILDILTSEGRTVAQGALAWNWGRTPQTIPIPGFRTVKQVEENAGAMEFGPLTPEQMSQIDVVLKRA
jgi:aryl-alcohol dehydrogenase-like predicted oxidoreductase